MTDSTGPALYWAKRGIPVFPCTVPNPNAPEGSDARKGKKPMVPHGFHAASTNPDTVRRDFAGRPALIGTPTGIASGIVVIDTDPPNGEDSLFDLQAELGDLPPTFTVRTARGGFHRYFRAWEGSTSSAGKLGQNIDVRGEGGYVILPPSLGYDVVDATEPAELPQQFRDLVTRRPVADVPEVPTMVDITEADLEAGDRYVASVLDGVVKRLQEMQAAAKPDPRDYQGPPWDDTTFRECCTVLELANSPWNRLDGETALNLILDNAPRDIGFGEEQITDKWRSAVRKIGTKGRPKPQFHDGFGIFDTPTANTPIPQAEDGTRVNPDTFFQKGEGLISDLLAQAVLDMGPLAIDDTPNRGIWAYFGGVWAYAPKEVQDRCTVLLRARFRPNHVSTIIPIIEKALVDQGAIVTCDPVTDYVNLRTGMLNWRTGQLEPHDPKFYSTVQLPVDWQPDAQCPNFDRFLSQVMAEDAIDFIWEVIGYLVLSGNPLQKAILFHGEGQNGKGTLIRVIESLLGSRNTSSVTLQDISEGKFETASLFGKIANLAGDIDPTYMRSTAKFKAITGEDMVDAQRKYEHGFKFRCWAVPVFSANKFWKSADTTSGYRRRWLLVSFPNALTKPVAGLSGMLAAELPGILVKAVRALHLLMTRGEFAPPASAQSAKEAFETAADQVKEWIAEDPAVATAAPGSRQVHARSSDAYMTYRGWAENNGLGAVSMPEFRSRLESEGYVFKKSSVVRIYGLELNLSLRHSDVPWQPEFDAVSADALTAGGE